MTAQPAGRIPASGPDTGSYEVIHLGGQAAVVPVSDFLRLQALEQAASPQELEDAEDKAAPADWRARRPPGRPHTYRMTRRCGGSAWPGEPPGHLGGPGDRPGGRVPRDDPMGFVRCSTRSPGSPALARCNRPWPARTFRTF